MRSATDFNNLANVEVDVPDGTEDVALQLELTPGRSRHHASQAQKMTFRSAFLGSHVFQRTV